MATFCLKTRIRPLIAALAISLGWATACGPTQPSGPDTPSATANDSVGDALVDSNFALDDGAPGTADVADVVDVAVPVKVIADVGVVDEPDALEGVEALDAQLDLEPLPDAFDVADGNVDASKEVDPLTTPWPGACVPADATVTTIGTIAQWPFPNPCPSTPCAKCAAPYQCSCAGDGSTGCAWLKMANMNVPRNFFTGVWGGGKLWVYGGYNTSDGLSLLLPPTLDPLNKAGMLTTAEVWDPATDKWTLLPQPPVQPDGHSIAWGDGKLYVAGNNDPAFPSPGAPFDLPWGPTYADYASYDPNTNQWTALPQTGSPGSCGTFAEKMFWINGKLFVRGCKPKELPAAYDPVTDQWSDLPKPPPGVPFKSQQGYANGLYFADYWGKNVYDPQTKQWVPEFHGALYNAASKAWSLFEPPACAPKLDPESIVAVDGGLFFWREIGASDTNVGAHRGFIYWFATAQWEVVPVPLWFANYVSRSITWSGKYIVLWWDSNFPRAGLYDPVARTWQSMAQAGQPYDRDRGVFVSNGAEVFVVGGDIISSSNFTTATAGRFLLPP